MSKNLNLTDLENLIFKMLTRSTGKQLMDSGDLYGRNWEANRKKTIADFASQPEVLIIPPTEKCDLSKDYHDYQISLFHWLNKNLSLDYICNEFNERNWHPRDYDALKLDSGVSKRAENWLYKNCDPTIEHEFNSYNWSSHLSQTIQGMILEIGTDKYLLLQIHGGCDVRGGYTPGMLFKFYDEFIDESIRGTITRKNGTEVKFSCYGANEKFTPDNSGEKLTFNPKTDKVTLRL